MTLERRVREFDHPEARIGSPEGWSGLEVLREVRATEAQSEWAARPELVERLARQLAWANSEDPDEQVYPMRSPRWCYYRSRAKALLSITPAEQRALCAVQATAR